MNAKTQQLKQFAAQQQATCNPLGCGDDLCTKFTGIDKLCCVKCMIFFSEPMTGGESVNKSNAWNKFSFLFQLPD